MIEVDSPYGPRSIGEESTPAFAIPPDPATLFMKRASRLRALAPGHSLEPYLRFVAEIAEAQHDIHARFPEPASSSAQVRQSLLHGMPPLARIGSPQDAGAADAVTLLLQRLQSAEMPQEARAAVDRLAASSEDELHRHLDAALTDVPTEDLAQRVLILAALQVFFTRRAAQLPASDLLPLGDALCPACGSPPMSSSVVGWPKAYNSRYCACSLCGTLWNVVRIKCVLCSSTAGISYRSIEGKPDAIKAETCETCGHYLKILYQVKDHLLDPLSDDVASLDLDMLVREEGWLRGGYNPFLLGY
jgi:FdhE protein